ncbi:Uncharacterized protein dnm_025090 [Desulfonema magnum]|uniref:Uncharacterized protein n=1 Tax=Desulfonema magnum TaxID=45655 RepID=A0A975GM32_9BACT|nr:Uncharacterized protein dnm_025090 [Desulfonema magnum]
MVNNMRGYGSDIGKYILSLLNLVTFIIFSQRKFKFFNLGIFQKIKYPKM